MSYRNLRRILFVVLAISAAAALVLAPSAGASPHEAGPHVRIAHLAPTAPAVDVYVNDRIVADGIVYKDVTEYFSLEGTEFKVVVVPAGGKPEADAITKQPAVLTFKEGDTGYYTVAAVGSPTDGTFALVLLPSDGSVATTTAMEKGSATSGNILVTDAWTRATARTSMHEGEGATATPEQSMGGMHMGPTATPGMGGMSMGGEVSAAYMTVRNTGDNADKLISVQSDAAGMIELHETIVKNDVAQMSPIEGGLEIPAGGIVELKPGGKHIMLMNLTRPFVAGETISLTLVFESGTTLTVTLPIVAP